MHCDIKSANVLLNVFDSGARLQAVVTDFGVARLLSSREVLVQEFKASRLNGLTLSYAAPEALRRVRGGAQVKIHPQEWMAGDVFATVMMLKEMLTRRGPWGNFLAISGAQ